MNEKCTEIKKIKYGEIHQFYPFKFENSKSFNELCDVIKKSKVLYTDEYNKKILDSIGYKIEKDFKNIEKCAKKMNLTVKMQDYERFSTMESAPITIDEDDIWLELDGSKINFRHIGLDELDKQIERLQREEGLAYNLYGNNYVYFQDRFILLPFKIELKNGKYVWLNATLYIFANNMAILKLAFPLIDIDIDDLKNSNKDILILSAKSNWYTEDGKEMTLQDIANIYLNFLKEDIGINYLIYSNGFEYISLVNFDGLPKQINNVPNDVQENIYRIIAAPVPERKCTSYINTAKEYLKKNSWGVYNVNYVVRTTGGCLSYIDQALYEEVIEEYKLQNNIDCLKDFDYYNINNDIATDIFANVELALLIVILKKINECSCYYEKRIGLKKLSQIQKDYNQNILFISELQDECFGSVSEQTEFFEIHMCHYLKPSITKQKHAAIDNILRNEETEKRGKLQNFLTKGGFLLSLLFGLPALYDMIIIIRKVFSFIPYNFPFITLENISLLSWIVLNTLIYLKLIKEKWGVVDYEKLRIKAFFEK